MCAPCDRGVRLARLNPSLCPCLSQGDWRSATDPKDCVKWLAHPFDEDDVHRALSKPYPVHIQRPALPDYYSDLYSSKGRELEGSCGDGEGCGNEPQGPWEPAAPGLHSHAWQAAPRLPRGRHAGHGAQELLALLPGLDSALLPPFQTFVPTWPLASASTPTTWTWSATTAASA